MARIHAVGPIEAGSNRRLRYELARQLHDGPMQQLSACFLRLETFRFANASHDMQDAITDVEQNLRATVASLRRIVSDLEDERTP